MCIIAIKPKGQKMFSDETIRVMYVNNPDGAGYMYYDYDRKKVCIKKGFMTCTSLLESLHSRDFTNTNVVMHFRIGTSGLNNRLNCHPYPIYQRNKERCYTTLGVAHNGILHSYNPPKGSNINDTQVFINTVLCNLSHGFQNDINVLILLEELIGTNKLAFLDSQNKLTLVGNFVEDNGYIFSNTSYKQTRVCTKKSSPLVSRGLVPSTVCTKKTESDGCVSKRFKLTEEQLSFWDDEPSKFWDEWDRDHPVE